MSDSVLDYNAQDSGFPVIDIPEFSDSATGDILPVTKTVDGNTVTDISDLVSKTILVRVKFGAFGNSKKVSGAAVLNTDADLHRLKVSKKLLVSKELTAIGKADQNIRRYLYDMCLPFDSGLMLLPNGLVNKVADKLKQFELERKELINTFVAVYSAQKSQAQSDLASQYNEFDYPPVASLLAKFHFSWRYVNLGTPDALKHINAELFKEEQDKFQAQYASAQEEITNLMRTSLYEVVKHLQDKLTPGDDGKSKILRESAITNVQEFLDTFDLRNVTNDKELAVVVAKARQLLTGTSAAVIKSSDEFRSKLLEGMESISASLSGLIVEKPGRKFRDDDEDTAETPESADVEITA